MTVWAYTPRDRKLRCPVCNCGRVETTTIGHTGRDPNTATCAKCHARGNADDWRLIAYLRELLWRPGQ